MQKLGKLHNSPGALGNEQCLTRQVQGFSTKGFTQMWLYRRERGGGGHNKTAAWKGWMLSSRGDHHLLGSSWLSAPMAGWRGCHRGLFLPLLMSRPKAALGRETPLSSSGQHSAACAKDGAVPWSKPLWGGPVAHSLLPMLSIWICLDAQPCWLPLRAALGQLWLPAEEQVAISTLRGHSPSEREAIPQGFLFPSFLDLFCALQFGSCTSVPQAVSHIKSPSTPCTGDTVVGHRW